MRFNIDKYLYHHGSINDETDDQYAMGSGSRPGSYDPDFEATQGGVLNVPTPPPAPKLEETLTGIEESYESVETGQVPEDYAAVDTGGITSEFNDGETYITPSATVAGQLTSLLDSDSKYIQQARLAAAEQSQSRGLLNSSMAAGAGEAAAIREGLPIAQQDAKAYEQAQLKQQDAEYSFVSDVAKTELSGRLTQQDAEIKMQNQIVQNTFESSMAQASDASKVFMQDAQNTYNTSMEAFKTQLAGVLNQQTFDASTKESLLAQSASIMQNYQISVEKIMTSPATLDLLASGPEGEAAINQMLATTQTLAANSIMMAGNVVDVDMSSYINTYLSSAPNLGTTTIPASTVPETTATATPPNPPSQSSTELANLGSPVEPKQPVPKPNHLVVPKK